MGMRQVYWGLNTEFATTALNLSGYTSPVTPAFRWTESLDAAGSYAAGRHPWLLNSTFRNWKITFEEPSDVQWTFTFFVNGAATALRVVIPAGSLQGSNIVDTATVAVGDLIAAKRSPSPAFPSPLESIQPKTWWTVEADHAEADGVSGYGANGRDTTNSVTRNGSYLLIDDWIATNNTQNVMPLNGGWLGYSILGDRTPVAEAGAGASIVFSFVVNGVNQDGSGGTVDTQATMTTLTTAAWSGRLPVTAGQRVQLRANIVGFGAGKGIRLALATKFESDTPNAFCAGGANNPAGSTAATQYMPTMATDILSGNFTAVEADAELLGSITPVTLSGLWVWLLTNPGSGDGWTYSTRLNGAYPGGGQTLTISGSANEGNTPFGSFTVGDGDRMAFESLPVVSPGSSAGIAWTFVGSIPPAPPPVNTGCPVELLA